MSPWCAGDHEYAVERGGIHSEIGKNGPDRAIYISTARAACICTPLTAASRKLEQACGARVLGVEAMTFCQRPGDNALQLSSLATVHESICEFPPLND